MIYKATFLRNRYNLPESDDIIRRSVYKVVSPVTNGEYRILIDYCNGNIYIIKFYLKRDEGARDKYNRLTGYREPRNLVETCISVLINDFIEKDENASFGFIASNLPNESVNNTKRFRFYETMMSTLIGSERFSHYKLKEVSAYLLIPRKIENHEKLVNQYWAQLNEHQYFVIE